jgi:hypothetical protein
VGTVSAEEAATEETSTADETSTTEDVSTGAAVVASASAVALEETAAGVEEATLEVPVEEAAGSETAPVAAVGAPVISPKVRS